MSEEFANVRAAHRYATDYMLRWVEIANEVHQADLLYSLVFTTLWAGNCSHLRGSAYAELDNVPPDHERRPLTVRQVADSLGLPYETVRRRFVEMLDRGIAQRVGREGFIVPQAVFTKPEFMNGLRRSHQSLMRFLKELKSVGVDAA